MLWRVSATLCIGMLCLQILGFRGYSNGKRVLKVALSFNSYHPLGSPVLSQHSFQRSDSQDFYRHCSSKQYSRGRSYTRKFCIGREVVGLPQPQEGVRRDADLSWQTNPTERIECFDKQQPHTAGVRPRLITFDAFDTLIQPSQSVGRWYREALNHICTMRVRLPQPKYFAASFKAAFAEMSESHPCFGAQSGMTAREWWYKVVSATYINTPLISEINPQEMETQLIPEVFPFLYDDVFGSAEGWVVKENAEYTLEKLAQWRDQGGGPKLGVISNFDDRLPAILEATGLAKYFDFIVTSYDAKCEKPQREIFDAALKTAGLPNSIDDCRHYFHIGNSLDSDVTGAAAASWQPVRYNEAFDEEFPDWRQFESTIAESEKESDRRAEFLLWGRRALDRPRPSSSISEDTSNDAGASQQYLEWLELWGLDDILTAFGFPEDENKLVRTTVLRGFLEDD